MDGLNGTYSTVIVNGGIEVFGVSMGQVIERGLVRGHGKYDDGSFGYN